MRERFTMLRDPRFNLVYNVTQRFGLAPAPTFVRLNREGFAVDAGIRKKTKVYPYMHLATHPSPGKGDLLSPIYGEVTDVTEGTVFIKYAEPDDAQKAAFEAVPETDILAAPERGRDLVPLLKSMGLNTKSLGQDCQTLIVNGLNPDPGVTWAEPMLVCHTKTIMAGLEMLHRLSPAERILLAVPEEMRLSYRDVEIVRVPARYPASLNPLVVKAVTGKENPEGVGVVGVHNVWSLGRVARTKKPLIETVITIGSLTVSGNYIVRDGSTVGELLEFSNLALQDGDTIVRGGPLRGESIDRMDRSITKGATSLFLVENGTVVTIEGKAPCVGCGSCSSICPARLRPDLLSRYAEFGLFERCHQQYISSCLECGLCSYVCIARRPVLQFIRLAKRNLGVPKPGTVPGPKPEPAARAAEAPKPEPAARAAEAPKPEPAKPAEAPKQAPEAAARTETAPKPETPPEQAPEGPKASEEAQR